MPNFVRPLLLKSPLMRGADVLAVQRALRSLGATTVEPDGVLGPQTAKAVAAFRISKNLSGDSVVDQPTWSLLFDEQKTSQSDDIATLVDRLATPHQFRDSVTWRLGPLGIAVGGAPAVGTPGEPTTIRRILAAFGPAIADTCKRRRVPAELVLATIAVESSGRPDARRQEPGYVSDTVTPSKVSVGLMQTLLSTANGAMDRNDIDANWLTNPANSIEAGVAYMASQLSQTGYDPPKVGCAYNAGSLQYDASPTNRWRMLQYPIGTSDYDDKLVAFFNDALGVLKVSPLDCPSFAAEFLRRGAGGSNPAIEALGLNPVASNAAYLLQKQHPEIVFTSGRRSKTDQARAMAQNIVQVRDYVRLTYAPTVISLACQKWVEDHPEATTVQTISAGLLGVMNSMGDDEAIKLSLHMTGNAFDVNPIVPDVNHIAATMSTLPGLKQFLPSEAGMNRWHAEFNPS